MSKHKRRSEDRNNEQQFNNTNPYAINPQQQLMDIIGSIGNGDMTQIANLLSSLNGDGVNFNNLDINNNMNANNNGNMSPNMNNNLNLNVNPNMQQNLNMQQQDFNPFQLLLSGLAGGGMPFPNLVNKKKPTSKKNDNSDMKEQKNNIDLKLDTEEDINNEEVKKDILKEDDDIIKMLKSIKILVGPNREKFIDKVIDLYLSGEFDDVI